jgi:hypothetical protein
MRPAAVALVLAAALAAGCGHHRTRVLTPADRRACERYVAVTIDPASSAYRGVVKQCLRQLVRPYAGGG